MVRTMKIFLNIQSPEFRTKEHLDEKFFKKF